MEFYVSVPFERLEKSIDFISREGLSPEVRMTGTEYLMNLTDEDIGRIARFLRERKFRIFSHAPFFGLDVASIDGGISRYSVTCLEKAIDVTAALGGNMMVMHTGYLPQYSRVGRRYWFRNWSVRMPRLAERARCRGITIALENTWDDRPEVLLHLRALLPERNNVKFCLDTGHLNVYSQLPLRRWWRSLGDDIVAIHLHDNDGLSDDHLPPGRGTVDFETLVELLLDMRTMPLLDLEVDHPRASEGRDYFVELFTRFAGARAVSPASREAPVRGS
jgi:sugar phosphate isomerase/epimerase